MTKNIFLGIILCSSFLGISASDSRQYLALSPSSPWTPNQRSGSHRADFARENDEIDTDKRALADSVQSPVIPERSFEVHPVHGVCLNVIINSSSDSDSEDNIHSDSPGNQVERRKLSYAFNDLSTIVAWEGIEKRMSPDDLTKLYARLIQFGKDNHEALTRNQLLSDDPCHNSMQTYQDLIEEFCDICKIRGVTISK